MNQPNPFKWRHARSREHFALRALLAQLSRPGGNDAGTGTLGGLYDHLPLGAARRSRTRKALSTSPQNHEWVLLQKLVTKGDEHEETASRFT